MVIILGIAFLLIFYILFKAFFKGKESRKLSDVEEIVNAEEIVKRDMNFKRNLGWYIKNTVKNRSPSSLEASIKEMHPEDLASLIRELIQEDLTIEQKKEKALKGLSKRQMSAWLIVKLEPETREKLFKHLREDEIKALFSEIKQLEALDSVQVKAVLQEFHAYMRKPLKKI